MNSRFKFPRRVRIHGGECGAVARALHHKAKKQSLPAASENVSIATNERKSMSTKTLIKRISLVVVSALGLGLMTWVAPANATLRKPTAISFSGTTGLRAGETKTVTVTFALPSGTVTGDTIAVFARVTSAPSTSFSIGRPATPGVNAINSTSAVTAGSLYWAKTGTGNGNGGTLSDISYNSAGATSTDNWTAAAEYTINTTNGDSLTSLPLSLKFGPDAAGSYTILVGVGQADALSYDTRSELAAASTANLVANLSTNSVTLSTGGVADAITLAAVTSGAPEDGTKGALWKATVTSAGAATSIAAGETIVLSSTSSTVSFGDHTGTALTNNTLTSSNFSAGVAYFTVQNTAEETATITATGAGLLSSSVTATGTLAFTGVDDGSTWLTTTTSTVTTNTGLALQSGFTVSASAGTYDARPGAASYTFYVNGTAANVETVRVTDTTGKLTGKAGAVFEKVVTVGTTGVVAFTLTPASSIAAGDDFTVALPASTNTTATKVETATVEGVASSATTMAVTNATRRVAAAATTSFTATLKDQYGAAMANEVVTVSVSGRNPTSSSASYTTNSSGQVTHSLTDAGTASVNDTVTFTKGSATASGTIIYGTSTAGTVALEGPNTDDTLITLSDKTDISAGASGAQAGVATVTATVTDASGNVMNGMEVVFTVSGTNCAILSTKATVYTNSAGEAATSVYKWTNGSCVVTATSGGKSGTDTVHFAQKTAEEARILAGSVSGNVITATVTDRFGNPVPSVYVWATRTGGGFFANGASSTSASTGEDGTVQFVYSQDSATAGTVKLMLGSASAADPEYGQSDASVNLVSSTTATDIFTATTTGTATTAETGVGASLAAAGVNSVTVTVAAGKSEAATAAEAASDAAAEAIDAANAATDAANLAAEAADAATVAAEEARDAADAATAAVEELATQVATLMAALKAQITTLANTVAKIAKKVKA